MKPALLRIAILTFAACFLFVGMEWLFQITKRSFLDSLGWWDKFTLPVTAPLFLFVLSAAVMAPVAGLFWMLRWTGVRWWMGGLLCAVPALYLSALAFMMLENFSYTLFRFSLVESGVTGRVLVGLFLVSVFLSGFRYALRWVRNGSERPVVAVFSVGLIVCVAVGLGKGTGAAMATAVRHGEAARFPVSVLILCGDGINADHMSVYGYGRDTTPFLRSILAECLLSENHFSNATASGASIGALLSGKYPTETGVIYPPDIFTGRHAVEHLPGLMRYWGYRGFDAGVRFYADAADLNIRNGFSEAWDRTIPSDQAFVAALQDHFPSESYFFRLLLFRLVDRGRHLFHLHDHADRSPGSLDPRFDRERVARLKAFILASDEPFFAHVHLMGPHGWRFAIENPVFSKGQVQDRDWMPDFYDDAIRDFDAHVADVFSFLRQQDLLERTLVMIDSDHGQKWGVHVRVPLLMRFPGGYPRGRLQVNTQRMDIAPTIAHYLSGKVPPWMSGHSLLDQNLSPLRPILSIMTARRTDTTWRTSSFRHLAGVQLVVGDRAYRLHLSDQAFSVQPVVGHTVRFEDEALPFPEEAEAFIRRHLRDHGYRPG